MSTDGLSFDNLCIDIRISTQMMYEVGVNSYEKHECLVSAVINLQLLLLSAQVQQSCCHKAGESL